MKEISVLTVKLLLICAIVAALLAGVNTITTPIIAANEQKNFETAMQEVLPDATTFEKIKATNFIPAKVGSRLDSIYLADNGGYVANVIGTEGYGGDIQIMVGILPDLTVGKLKIMTMSETPGLGAKASASSFLNQYQALSGPVEVIKNAAPVGNQVQAIAGATVTTKAVTKAVNTALEAAAYAKEQKGGATK